MTTSLKQADIGRGNILEKQGNYKSKTYNRFTKTKTRFYESITYNRFIKQKKIIRPQKEKPKEKERDKEEI